MRKWFHYTQADLVEALRKAGVKRGDIIFSHIDIRNMGIPKEMYEEKTAFDVILGAVLETIGPEGTFLTPTYSYSLCWNEIFDPQKTPSAVGAFGNKFMKVKGVKRSCEPIFSVAGIGPKTEELFSNLPHTCFGNDCIYQRLLRLNATVCNIGLGLSFITPIHYFEECISVPYRFLKLFSGYVRCDGKLNKETRLYSVRVLGDYSQPVASRLGEEASKMGLCRVAPVGLSQVTAIDFQDAYEICKRKIKENPWYLAKGPACDPFEREKERVGVRKYDIQLPQGASMEQMVRSLWHLPKDIVSDGYDAALEALAAQVPMTIHEYPTGMKCFTQIIPEKWTCHEAYLQTLGGKRLFSYDENPLHVASYSLPFEGEVNREELFQHLHVHAELPNAIPFVLKYYEGEWGLCCRRRLKDSLIDPSYRVVIKTDFSYSKLKVGEIILQGESEQCFVFYAHLCGSCMVNDGLTGVVVGIDVMRSLLRGKKFRYHYTYRFILVPETIGLVAYLSLNRDLIPKMIGGLFLGILATTHSHMLRPSLKGDTHIDRCIGLVVKEHDSKARIGDFSMAFSDDVHILEATGVSVPVLWLSRTLPEGGMYRGYHSSYDVPEKANFQNLEDSRDLVLQIIDAIEQNRLHP